MAQLSFHQPIRNRRTLHIGAIIGHCPQRSSSVLPLVFPQTLAVGGGGGCRWTADSGGQRDGRWREADLVVAATSVARLVSCHCRATDPQTERLLGPWNSISMDGQPGAAVEGIGPRVKANLVLGSESFAISPESGILSEQLAAMKEKSMEILKEYITKHNAPNDVPDESIEGESDDEGEALVKNPPKKSKKQK